MTIDPDSGLVQWTPTAGQLGSHTVTVSATDPAGQTARQSFTLTVRAANRAPTITSTPALTITAGLGYRYDVRATDPDGEPLTFRLDQAPAGMSIGTQGRIAWPTAAADVGTHPIQVVVTDSRGLPASQSFDLMVLADTQAPRVTLSVSPNPVPVDSTVTFVVSTTDNVGVAAVQLTVGGTPVALDSSRRATVPFATVGVVDVVATARDAAGNAASAMTTVLVFDPAATGAPTVSLDMLPNDGARRSASNTTPPGIRAC